MVDSDIVASDIAVSDWDSEREILNEILIEILTDSCWEQFLLSCSFQGFQILREMKNETKIVCTVCLHGVALKSSVVFEDMSGGGRSETRDDDYVKAMEWLGRVSESVELIVTVQSQRMVSDQVLESESQ